MSDRVEKQVIAILVIVGLAIVIGAALLFGAHPCVRWDEYNNVGVDGVVTASGTYCAEHK